MGRTAFSRITLSASLIGALVVGAGSPPTASAAEFDALSAPQRIADTRPSGETVDDLVEKIGPRPGGTTLELQVAGRAGIDQDALAVVLNVTTTGATGRGFITIHPCDTSRPNSANLNYEQGQIIANAVIAKLDDNGKTCIYTSTTANVIVDATGSLPDGAFEPLAAPQRIVDTRPTGETVDDLLEKIGPRPGGSVTTIKIGGRAGIPSDASSVALNVTTTSATGRGFFTVFPCGSQPNTANLNYEAGQIIANSVVAKLNDVGETCIFTNTQANMIVDVTGALPPGSYTSLASPARIVDTRASGATVDKLVEKTSFRRAGTTLSFPVTGRADIPADASAVILNVTAASARGRGFLTLHPRNSGRPVAANLNYEQGQIIANTVVAKIGGNGNVCLFSSEATEVIVDVAGYLTGAAPIDTGVDCPFEFPGVSDFDDPFYPVGPYQFPPGRYKADVTTEIFCRAARLGSDDQFDVNGIIEPFEGPVIIDVLASDAFVHYRFDSCPPLKPYRSPLGPPAESFTSGYYVAGENEEIAPGTYRSGPKDPSASRCGAYRYSSFLGDPAFGRPDPTVIEAVLGETGNQTIRVRESDAGVSFGNTCGPWVKISG